MIQRFISRSEEETDVIGAQIAASLPRRGVVFLQGDLGAGKTSLIRAIVTALGCDRDEVSSPTFAIENEYPLEDGSLVVHLDCYRLSDHEREWEQIGIPELLNGERLVLVEWPKEGFARYATPAATIEITVDDHDAREIRLEMP